MKFGLSPKSLALLRVVNDLLAERGVAAYLVGGLVRDVPLGRESEDIDIAVADDAPGIARALAADLSGRFILLDEANAVGRIVLEDKGARSGRWELDFSSIVGGIDDDLGRRDFTIDAMAVDLGKLAEDADDVRLIDPFGGYGDLEHGVVRAVSETVFKSDAARLLRAVRLGAELGFFLDSQTEALIREDCHLIASVAGERVREELLRLLAVPQPRGSLRYLDSLGLLTAIFPELAPARGVAQPPEHYWDVLEHSVETVAAVDFLLREGGWEYANDEVLAAVPWSEMLAQHFAQEVSHGSTRRTLLKLAALLHDVAKPQTKATGADGRTHFLGHAKLGAEVAAGILGRLRFSSRETRLVEAVVREHLRPTQMSQEGLPSHRAIYRYFRDSGEAGVDTLFLSLADHLATRGPGLDLGGWREHTRLTEYVLQQHLEQERLVKPTKLVDGYDIINIFGLSPGPRVGQLLEAVREAQASGELTRREEALAFIRKRLTTEVVNRYG